MSNPTISEASSVTIVVEYTAQLNWSLLRTGVPFVFRLFVKQSLLAGRSLHCRIFIRNPLNPTEYLLNPTELRINLQDCNGKSNLSGNLHPLLVNQWGWWNGWGLGNTPANAIIELSVEGFPYPARCPIILLPPSYWHRVIPRTDRPYGELPTCLATISLTAEQTILTTEERTIAWEDAGYASPPFETGLAALIDPNDPYVQQDGSLDTFGRRVLENILLIRGEARRSELPNFGVEEVFKALYLTVLQREQLKHVDFLHTFQPDVQAVRLLNSDRERGAVCLDLVVLSCEVLEALRLRPIFILTAHGAHAVLGVWTSPEMVFANRQPVCRSAAEIAALVRDRKIQVLDVTQALLNVDYKSAQQDSDWERLDFGFVHALDIVATRNWSVEGQRFTVLPLPRPRPSSGWVRRYLEQYLKSDQAPIEENQDFRLDDPAELFVPITCDIENSAVRPVLKTVDDNGWLYEQVIQRSGKVALLGAGGAGKSYVCRRAALTLAKAYLQGDANDLPVPIFYPLRLLPRAANLLVALARWVGCGDENDLRGAAYNHRLIFFLDALDESDASRQTNTPAQYAELLRPVFELPNCSVVLTTRPTIFPGDPGAYLQGFSLASVRGWDAADFRYYLSQCAIVKGIEFRDSWERFYERIFGGGGNPKLRELTSTPLFARMIVETRDEIEQGAQIHNELDLYRRYTRHCFSRRKDLGLDNVEEAHEATAEIAFSMYLHDSHTMKDEAIGRMLSSLIGKRDADIYRQFSTRDLLVHGLLVAEGDRAFHFSHLSIEHYFLAERLLKALEYLPSTGKVPEFFGYALLAQSVVDFLGQALRDAPEITEQLTQMLPGVPQDGRRRLLQSAPLPPEVRKALDPNRAFRNLALVCLKAVGSLAACDLRRLDLSGMDLSRADMHGANLNGSILRSSVLMDADLSGCSLREADLREADLTGAVLRQASLDRCKLSRIRVRDFALLPLLCGCARIETVEIDPNDRQTVWLLLQCVAGCEGDPEMQDWGRATRAALESRFIKTR